MWLLIHPSGSFIQYLFGSKHKEPFSVASAEGFCDRGTLAGERPEAAQWGKYERKICQADRT